MLGSFVVYLRSGASLGTLCLNVLEEALGCRLGHYRAACFPWFVLLDGGAAHAALVAVAGHRRRVPAIVELLGVRTLLSLRRVA